MKKWQQCKNLLLIRLDNMGDVIMNNAAFATLKEQLPGCKLTLLTSSMAAPILPYLDTIDESIIFDVPWMKLKDVTNKETVYFDVIEKIRFFQFDGCILFSVYSQNIFPAALMAYLAAIPLRGGYARENPYHLLTHWIPDPEPLRYIHHQIKRDLLLLEHLGLTVNPSRLPTLHVPRSEAIQAKEFLTKIGIPDSFIVVNFDVSESKREFPAEQANRLIRQCLASGHTVVSTGVKPSPYLQSCIAGIAHNNFYNSIEQTSIHELISLITNANAVISLNTGVAHVACAFDKPTCVLYANSNPQHGPWSQYSVQFNFEIPQILKSKNEIICYVDRENLTQGASTLQAEAIVENTVNWLASITTKPVAAGS
ncbi:glycosyltransferase family 9 protein [Sphingobacterium kitahiroshimense]|uniref:Glycosyltransferase family 9 protein n=1 Tax=Sphingobacterium kitahiroshimense TaxID=470446 RepID=A0ABV0BZS8_9SPHI